MDTLATPISPYKYKPISLWLTQKIQLYPIGECFGDYISSTKTKPDDFPLTEELAIFYWEEGAGADDLALALLMSYA